MFHPLALQLRALQTLVEISVDKIAYDRSARREGRDRSRRAADAGRGGSGPDGLCADERATPPVLIDRAMATT
jgi:hypothetical protein